jgi:phage shock protein PspC (stress-responsive transcriptional regulator)
MFPIERHPSPRQLAIFGLTWLALLAIWGTIAWWNGSPTAAGVCWGLAVAVPALGLLRPGLLRIVYLAMVYATFPIGLVISYVILAATYYLVLTPIGLLLRLFGYDPMHRRFDRQAKTYWVPREEDANTDHVFRQF